MPLEPGAHGKMSRCGSGAGKAAGVTIPEPEDLLEMTGNPAENRCVQKP